jgi:hypothetical protein
LHVRTALGLTQSGRFVVSITSPRSQIALVFITPGSQIIASASAWETSSLAAEVRLMRPKAVITLIKMVGFMLIFFEESLREEKRKVILVCLKTVIVS